MNQAVFPTVWKASSLSKTWWGQALHRQGKTIHQRQTTVHSFSLAPRNTTCGPVWRSQSRYTFTKNESNNAALNRPEAIKIGNRIFRYFMNLLWWTAMKHSKWACHHVDFFSRHSAQDNLVWYLDCSRSNMKSRSSILPASRRNCFQLVPLHQEGKAASHPQEKARKKNGKQLWVSLLGGGGRNSNGCFIKMGGIYTSERNVTKGFTK